MIRPSTASSGPHTTTGPATISVATLTRTALAVDTQPALVDIEKIADAVGHINSNVTRTVYRHQIADVVSETATVWTGSTRREMTSERSSGPGKLPFWLPQRCDFP